MDPCTRHRESGLKPASGCAAGWAAWFEGVAVAAASWATYALFHNPMGLIFACGCTWSFRGGWKQCNVHFLGLRSPRCPWCVSPRDTPNWTWTTGETCTIAVMVASWLLTMLAVSPQSQDRDQATYSVLDSSISTSEEIKETPTPWCRAGVRSSKRCVFLRCIMPLLAFLLHHSIVGLAFAIGTGYPYFYFLTLPNTQPPSLPLPPFINASAVISP